MGYPILDTTKIQFARGAGWKKTPHFNTITQKPAAVRGIVTASLVPYPTWDFECELVWTRGDESSVYSTVAAFMDVFIQCLGSGVFFLVPDPKDQNVYDDGTGVMLNVTPGAAAPMTIVGDAVSTQFQLARTIGPSGKAFDIIQNLQATPSALRVNGAPQSLGTDYSLSSTGVVTFATAPALNAALTWYGTFYFLCQFIEDTLGDLARVGTVPTIGDPTNFDGLWTCGNIKFSSIFI